MFNNISAQVFLSSYDALENYLRGICDEDESNEMIPLYIEVLTNPDERSQLNAIYKLRNDLIYGVLPLNQSTKVDKTYVIALNDHLEYVRCHEEEVRNALVSFDYEDESVESEYDNDGQDDELDESALYVDDQTYESDDQIEELDESTLYLDDETYEVPSIEINSASIRKVYIENVTGILTIESSNNFYCELHYSIKGDSLIISNCSGVGSLCLPPSQYDLLSIKNASGTISIESKDISFKRISKTNFSGILSTD